MKFSYPAFAWLAPAIALVATTSCADIPVSPRSASGAHVTFDRSAPRPQVVVWVAPRYVIPGQPFALKVVLLDQQGQAWHGREPFTASLASNVNVLSGTTHVQSSDGSAWFTDLVVSGPCSVGLVISAPDATPANFFLNTRAVCR